ncbi:hypothetical protein [Bacteroides caecimuris]|uniref:hypothetical protein n=1 Tax=Bacteroides caecimuris TaxID=1796613 RepID=UPI002573C783|nr:hypothetical protein [Bacteroides caecimuris]
MDLILIPSSRAQMKWLDVDDNFWNSPYKVRFCLYDPECDVIEICLTMSTSESDAHTISNLRFWVDGQEITKSLSIFRTTWRGTQFIILLNDIADMQIFRCEEKESASSYFEAYNGQQRGYINEGCSFLPNYFL